MAKALFFPSYLGGGFGNVGRCLALADELARQGWTVAMALAGPNVEAVRRAGYPVFEPRFPFHPRRSKAGSPAYTYVLDGSIQALRDGFVRPWRVRLAVAETLRIVRHFRPDVLIGDFSLLTWITGQRAGLPVVQIVQSILHPTAPRIIWWQDPPAGMTSPNVGPVFNPVLSRWNLEPIGRAEDLLRGDLFLVPGIPELGPLPGDAPNTHYIGVLSRSPPAATPLPAPLDGSPEEPVVYVTVGGGAKLVGSQRFFHVLNQAFEGVSWPVIVSTGRKFTPSELPPAPPNMFYHQWVPGPAVIQRSAAVVFHGGYNTMMETVRYGVPSVVIPFHSEQESNGRRLEACQVARVLSPAAAGDSMRLVRSRWAYGEFATWIQPDSPLVPETLRAAACAVLENPQYRVQAMALAAAAARYRGAPAAAELISTQVGRG